MIGKGDKSENRERWDSLGDINDRVIIHLRDGSGQKAGMNAAGSVFMTLMAS